MTSEISNVKLLVSYLAMDMFSLWDHRIIGDIIDWFHNIYIEVKTGDRFAASQLLYGSVYGVNDPLEYKIQYFGLANENECRFYKAPHYNIVEEFARKISPDKSIPPSSVGRQFRNEAFEILGDPVYITYYDTDIDLEKPYVFITMGNIMRIAERLKKYGIDIREFLSKFSHVWEEGGNILIMKRGGIGDDIDHENFLASRPIRNPEDQQLIKQLRVTPSDLQIISQKYDTLESISNRRQFGKFYTSFELASEIHNLITQYDEPMI